MIASIFDIKRQLMDNLVELIIILSQPYPFLEGQINLNNKMFNSPR